MRFVLSILLAFFFFATPLRSNAGSFSPKQPTLKADFAVPGTGITNCSIIDQEGEAVIPFHQGTNSVTHFRCHVVQNFINNLAYIGWIKYLPAARDRIEPLLHFKSIGLKLVFPKHYFW
jgi:hypothetical protein